MAKCKFCKKQFTQFNSTISVCGYQCAIKWGKLKPVKAAYKRVATELKREAKDKLETHTQRINKVKPIFQKWIRERDKNEPCISCGVTKTYKDEWDGGHFHKAENYTGVIFNEHNVNKQCKNCNKNLDGNLISYRQGLVKKIGLKAVEELEELANNTRYYKWSDEELQQIKNKYKIK
jgi:hypothetical protein